MLPSCFRNLARLFLIAAAGLVILNGAAEAQNNEPAQCLSSDPTQWPAPSKPYFMLAVDTSSSMAVPVPFSACSTDAQCAALNAGTCSGNVCTGAAPPCALFPSNRSGYVRCALSQVLPAWAGDVNFGIAGFPLQQSACTSSCTCTSAPSFACFSNCSYTAAAGDPNPTSPNYGCGPITSGDPATRRGANILVPMLQDRFWATPPAASNMTQLTALSDNSCAGSTELWAQGKMPINGMLRDLTRYFQGTYVNPNTLAAVPSPIDATNERACRSINIVLVVSGDENCDTFTDATNAATALFNGVTVGGITWNIRTHVIAFVGGANAAVIAGSGASSTVTGTTAGHGYFFHPTDTAGVQQALSVLFQGSLRAETCDNTDNNCNGCTDEGYAHYADAGQTCCAWATSGQRSTCLANFQSSITVPNPKGNRSLLPCTTALQAATPATWLCYDPGDQCDNIDNNGNGQVDEGSIKCGSPLHCPQAEVCNGLDDNCNGVVDDGGVCGSCVWSAEVCDGCDNDCNGVTDNGIAPTACGLTGAGEPPNCQGVRTCKPPQAVPIGGCIAGGGYNACSISPQPEVCDGLDNDCNGIVDDNVPSQSCEPSGTPGGLIYGGTSQCQHGHTSCANGVTSCQGFVGPSAEVCDGIDNDCNGAVDDNVTGIGNPCGSNIGACQPGLTACLNGALACQGGVQPQPEVCDGIDNDCDGVVDGPTLCSAGLVCRGGQCVTP